MSDKAVKDVGEGKNKKRKKDKPLLVRFLRWFVLIPLFILVLALGGLSAAFVIFAECSKDLPNVEKLKFYSPSETTKIYSSDGHLLATLYKENREWVSYDKIPENMIKAIVAIEDSRFYQHRGISFRDIIRAAYIDIKHRGVAQGASTITQQLARNIFLHPRTTIRRKIREALLAVQIEKKFTKREILELYLNQIYFGAGAYGIQAAAKTYFGKDVSKLTLPECAMLAGLPAAPSDYSPLVNPKLAKYRQILVLKRMHDLGFIDYKTMKKAIDTPLVYKSKRRVFHGTIKYPYFTTYALHELFQKYSDDLLYRGGLKIYTTLDPKMQKIALKAVKHGLERAKLQGLNCHQAALVAIEPSTGFIRAMVGGSGWSKKNQFNRAWQARRQPGSAFKIFVYTAAIDSGFTPNTIILDSPVSYPEGPGRSWSPKNCDGSYWGPIPLKKALQFSRNVAAVRLMHRLGPEKVIQYAYKMGIKDKLEPHLSLALGSGVVTPLDMASAVSVLANEGVRVEPTAIKKIIDSEGNVIEDNTIPTQEMVIPATTAATMVEMMQAVIQGGTGTRAQIGRPAAGKTGTTDSFRDAWFVGFTPDLACAVWTGNDDFSRMNYAYGGNIPASIWAEFMKNALKGKPIKKFHKPKSDLIAVLICDDSGLLATAACPHTHKEFFRRGTEPKKYCPIHGERIMKADKVEKKKPKKSYEPEVIEEDLLPPEDFSNPQNAPPPEEPDVIIEEPIKAPPKEAPPAPEGRVDL